MSGWWTQQVLWRLALGSAIEVGLVVMIPSGIPLAVCYLRHSSRPDLSSHASRDALRRCSMPPHHPDSRICLSSASSQMLEVSGL